MVHGTVYSRGQRARATETASGGSGEEREGPAAWRVRRGGGVGKRLGARVIRVIAGQLHYLINLGGRTSQSPSAAVSVIVSPVAQP